MKYFLSILFVTFTINLKANDYRYIGELNGDNIYLYHIYEDHKFLGIKTKIFKILFVHSEKKSEYVSSTLHLQVNCKDQSFLMIQQFQQCIDKGLNCPIKDVYTIPERLDIDKESILSEAANMICNT